MNERATLLEGFRERLTELRSEKKLSQAEFARQAGIDRSTMSQLLSDQNRRLPRVETLVALSQATGASVDWLLGLSADGQSTTDIVQEELAVHRGALSDLDELIVGWYKAARGMKVRYIPASLPDLLKIESTIEFETSRFATVYTEQKIATARAPLDMARTPGTDVECCNSVQAIRSFARGEDVWVGLSAGDRRRQLDTMIERCDELYPTFRWFLYDARQRFSSPTTVFGMDRVLVYLGQMYIVLNHYDQVVAFIEQFDDLVRAAEIQPPDVADVLRDLRSEIK